MKKLFAIMVLCTLPICAMNHNTTRRPEYAEFINIGKEYIYNIASREHTKDLHKNIKMPKASCMPILAMIRSLAFFTQRFLNI